VNEKIMPSPAQPGKGQRKGQCVGIVSARISAAVLASSGHFQETVTVCIEDRRHSRGVIVATFGQTKIETQTITPTEYGVRLERKETHRNQVIRHYWIEISAANWAKLLCKAGVDHDLENGNLREAPIRKPEPTPTPPMPTPPVDLHGYYPTGNVAGSEYDGKAAVCP
jgi:hypothetical protein